MAKRIKVSEPTLASRAEAEEALGEIRELTIKRTSIITANEAKKKRIDELSAPLLAEIDKGILAKTEQLRVWATANPTEFQDKKSLPMIHGVIGFRKGQPHRKTLAKWTWEKVLLALKLAKQKDFIRTKEEEDKEALLSRAQQEKSPFPIAEYGLKIEQLEPFFVEPKIEEQDTRITTDNAVTA